MTDRLDPRALLETLRGENGPTPEPAWVEQKVGSAEANLAFLRVVAVAVNVFVYLALMDHAQTMVPLASVVIGLSIPYAVYVWYARPYQDEDVRLSSELLSATDGVLIAGWIMATGGFASPFFVLWYAAIAGVAYRYNLQRVLLESMGYIGLYLAVLASTGTLTGHGAELALRVVYIPIVGAVGGLFSRAYFEQVRERYAARERLQEERMEALAEAHTEVQAQEEKWRSILLNTPDHIVVVDHQGKIQYTNRDLPQASEEQVLGTNIREHVPKPFRSRLETGLTRAFGEGEITEFELMGQGEDGEPRWYAARVGPLAWDGEVQGATIVSTDVTDRKEAQEEMASFAQKLAEHASQLERSNDELTHYAEVAAHDLQEPLRDIARYAQLLDRRYGDHLDAQAQEFISFTVNGAKRMHDLLSELLHYSQLRAATMDLQPVDVGDVLENVRAHLRDQLDDAGAILEWGELPTVLADPKHLEDVLTYLVDNAITYNDSPVPQVRITADRHDGRWDLAVEDNGIGIDPAHQARVFEPFKRLHNRGEYPGTGMGLPICQRVIEAHGGHMWVDSQAREGSIFHLTLAPAHEFQAPWDDQDLGEGLST